MLLAQSLLVGSTPRKLGLLRGLRANSAGWHESMLSLFALVGIPPCSLRGAAGTLYQAY